MALTLLQTIKFGLGYFILVLVWTILYNYLKPSFLEIFFFLQAMPELVYIL
jgi:hypothetical protein